ncbi:MAG: hypothetical protein ACRC33_15840 [Gemmataceae bacterium]
MTFAEPSACVPAWERGLEGWGVTESPIVNRWILGGRIATRREDLLSSLENRFPAVATPEVREAIQRNESLDLLQDWIVAVARVKTGEEFLEVLRR